MQPALIAARRIIYSGIPGTDPLSVMNRLFCGWIVRDRFNFLNHYLPYRVVDTADEIPVADESLTIADICDAKAKEILASNKPVTVSWSGGVDSTAVVTSLLRNGIDPEALTVLHAPSSKVEYPWFYNHLQEKGIRMIESDELSTSFSSLGDSLLVTGWCADQLFGSNIHLRNLDLYNLPWIDGVKQAFTDRGLQFTSASFDKLAEVYNAYAEHVGVKMEQFCEFAWLYNFGIKWSYVSQDARLACTNETARANIINFFEDIRFQRWAMAKYPTLRGRNVNRAIRFYKRPLKLYIYLYTEDPDYRNHKGKVNSWAQVGDTEVYNILPALDTEGYHVFRLQGDPENPNLAALRRLVAKRYLKDEYLGSDE